MSVFYLYFPLKHPFETNAALSGPPWGVRFECLVLHSRSVGTLHSPLSAAFPTSEASGEPVIRQFISPVLVSYKTIAESIEPVNNP